MNEFVADEEKTALLSAHDSLRAVSNGGRNTVTAPSRSEGGYAKGVVYTCESAKGEEKMTEGGWGRKRVNPTGGGLARRGVKGVKRRKGRAADRRCEYGTGER